MSKKKTITEEFEDDYQFVRENSEQLFPYLEAGFNGLIEGASLYSISFQLTDNGEYRFIARATGRGDGGTEVGFVAYGSAPTMAEIMAAVECCLRYDILGWRVDKYWKPKEHKLSQAKALRKVTIGVPVKRGSK